MLEWINSLGRAAIAQVEFVPEVHGSPDGSAAQDGEFFFLVGSRLLPPRVIVEAFNDKRCCVGTVRSDKETTLFEANRQAHLQAESVCAKGSDMDRNTSPTAALPSAIKSAA